MAPSFTTGQHSGPLQVRVTQVVRSVPGKEKSAVVHSSADPSLGGRLLDTFSRQEVPAALMCPNDKATPASLEESEVRHLKD